MFRIVLEKPLYQLEPARIIQPALIDTQRLDETCARLFRLRVFSDCGLEPRDVLLTCRVHDALAQNVGDVPVCSEPSQDDAGLNVNATPLMQ